MSIGWRVKGREFRNAFVTAPVCSPCRSALITGMYQTTIGAHQHRSGRGVEKIHLPAGVTPVPALFQKAGYFTCIGSGLPGNRAGKKGKGGGLGKTDYNFEWDAKMYDAQRLGGAEAGQPFFMQVQLAGGKLRGGNDASAIRTAPSGQRRNSASATDRGERDAAALLSARSGACCAIGRRISIPSASRISMSAR